MFSLWFVQRSNEPLCNSIAQDIIHHFAVKHDAPSFYSHITLIGSIPDSSTGGENIIQKTIDLLQLLKLKRVDFSFHQQVAIGNSMWQSVFLKAHLSESLQNLFAQVTEFFGKEPSQYMPHLSVIYSESIEREVVAEEAQKILFEKQADWSFTADTLEIWETNGPVTSWKLVKQFNLLE